MKECNFFILQKVSTPILIYNSYKNSLNNRKVGKSRSIILYHIGNTMIAHSFLRAWASAYVLNENVFPWFPQFVDRSLPSAIAGDYVAIIARKSSPEMFLKFFPEFPGAFKKFDFRIPLNDDLWPTLNASLKRTSF